MADVVLYANTSLSDAQNLTLTQVSAFFQSKSFKQWREGRDAEVKLQVGIAERLNSVIRGLNIVAKVAARKG